MTRYALRGLGARRLRTLLTAFAVVLGVAMVTAALTVTDQQDRAAASLSSSAYSGTDAVLTTRTAFDTQYAIGTTREPVPASVLREVAARPDVAAAAGEVLDEARLIGENGKPVGKGPYFGIGYDGGAERLSPLRLADGRWARADGEVVVDAGTAEAQGWRPGDRIRVDTRGPARTYELTGLVRFGSVDSLGQATITVFALDVAQRLYGKGDGVDPVLVAARDGVAPGALRRELAASHRGLAVRTAEAQDRFTFTDLDEFVGVLRAILLVLAGISVFVGAFTIVNTLSITVAQRTGELGLLRALGASRGQVRRLVVTEAAGVGLVGVVLGVPAGYALALGLDAAFTALGLELPEVAARLNPVTVGVALAVGLGATLAASLVPARRATKVAPVEALRASAMAGEPGRIGRAIRAVAGLVGRPAEWVGGPAGRLARRNAMRRPGRTAATAAAMTVGVMLVAGVAALGAGLKEEARSGTTETLRASLVIIGQDGFSPVDPAAADAVRAAPGAEIVTTLRSAEARAFGERAYVDAVDPAVADRVLRYDTGTRFAELGADGALVQEDWARTHGLQVGSRFTAASASGERLELVVRGTHRVDTLNPLYLGEITVSRAAFDRAFTAAADRLTLVSGASTPALERALAAFPDAKAWTVEAYGAELSRTVDQLLAIFYVLLALAVLVSLFGIVNTLVLSVIERTREIGMLKAVGMSRRQVRRMVRHESIITALLGAGTGIALGLALAAVVAAALADVGLSFAVPVGSLAVFVAVAVAAGVAAAVLPARRAARLDPLGALAYE